MCAKNHSREMKFWFKQKTRRRMNIDTLENHLERNSIKKLKKTVKIKVKLPYANKNPPRENEFLCSNIVFSLYFNFRAEKIHAANTLAFSYHFLLFRRHQNHYSNLTSKIMKLCEQIFKKNSRTSPVVQFKEFSLIKEKT